MSEENITSLLSYFNCHLRHNRLTMNSLLEFEIEMIKILPNISIYMREVGCSTHSIKYEDQNPNGHFIKYKYIIENSKLKNFFIISSNFSFFYLLKTYNIY